MPKDSETPFVFLTARPLLMRADQPDTSVCGVPVGATPSSLVK